MPLSEVHMCLLSTAFGILSSGSFVAGGVD